MKFLGVDPGASGAVSVFDDLSFLGVMDLSHEVVSGEKMFDLISVRDEIIEIAGGQIDMVFIEKVGARSAQGVKSMFSFGERFAEVKCLGLTLTKNVVFLTPQSWKASAGLIGQDKNMSAKKCAKLYPDLADSFVQANSRCKDGFKYFDGRGDSALIGLMGYKKFKKEKL